MAPVHVIGSSECRRSSCPPGRHEGPEARCAQIDGNGGRFHGRGRRPGRSGGGGRRHALGRVGWGRTGLRRPRRQEPGVGAGRPPGMADPLPAGRLHLPRPHVVGAGRSGHGRVGQRTVRRSRGRVRCQQRRSGGAHAVRAYEQLQKAPWTGTSVEPSTSSQSRSACSGPADQGTPRHFWC